MKLTYDALLHVVSSSRYAKDAVQLIATCPVLYHEGPKIALKKPVFISTAKQLDSFLKFLRADNSSRCRYLKHLELREFYLKSDVVQQLIETLPLLTSLELLRLDDAEEFLDLHPDLMPALCSLTTLRYIDFARAKGETCALMLGLHSSLISICIDFLLDSGRTFWDDLPDDEWKQSHPTVLLGRFAMTLEELQCVAWHTDKGTVIPEKVYPNLGKLFIAFHEFPLRIDPFIRAFPNLTDLHVNTNYHNGIYLDDIQESHEMNVAQQLDAINSCGTWAHLEHFHGCLFDLYAIGLTSHIRRLTIVSRLYSGPGPRMEMLATVLRYARPLHLKLEGITGSMLGDADRGFISMLHHHSASGIFNLDICVYFDEDDREKDLAAVIGNLISAMTRLPIRFLELGFVTDDLDPTPKGPSEIARLKARKRGLPVPPKPTPAPLTPAELSLQTLDMDALVARLEAMPSLEAAHVVLPPGLRYGCGPDWNLGHDRTIMKGTTGLAGPEQWKSWIPGKNQIVM